jgi:hypothetical protein
MTDKHFFNGQLKKRLSDCHAFFGWAIEENILWPPSVFWMGN